MCLWSASVALLVPLAPPSITAVIAGTDEGAIIEVLTQRSNAQRQQILKAYKAHYGRVLPAPSSHPAPSFCPFPHRDLPLAERNPPQGAVGSQGTPICSGMASPRKTKLPTASCC